MKIKTEIEIPEQRIKDLLSCAFEGGSGYWCQIKRYEIPGNAKSVQDYPHLDLPLMQGGGVFCADAVGGTAFCRCLNLDAIKEGLELLLNSVDKHGNDIPKYHGSDFLSENEDAITGDVFLQLCLFGEIVYG